MLAKLGICEEIKEVKIERKNIAQLKTVYEWGN